MRGPTATAAAVSSPPVIGVHAAPGDGRRACVRWRRDRRVLRYGAFFRAV